MYSTRMLLDGGIIIISVSLGVLHIGHVFILG